MSSVTCYWGHLTAPAHMYQKQQCDDENVNSELEVWNEDIKDPNNGRNLHLSRPHVVPRHVDPIAML
jgi:hypothetical protein